ncbi:MAG: trigger factor [Thermoleophilia bacterium]|nr:trigger factor [Thermoleophilia bacterium]
MPVTAEATYLPGDLVRIAVTIPEDDVRKEFDRTVKGTSGRMRLPGFRPGKVPANVVIRRVGREALLSETLDRAIDGWYREALAITDVAPIDSPDMEMGDAAETGVTFSVTVRVPPTATLGQYTGLEVIRESAEIPEGAVDEELRRIREQSARLEQTDRTAAEGDFVLIDYDAVADGTPVPEASSRGQLVELGGERILPEFTAGLLGTTAGDKVTIDFAYPDDDARDEVRGKRVAYAVTVQTVQEKVLPEMDDAFAESVGFASAAELRAETEVHLAAAMERTVTERYRRRAIDAAVLAAELEVPGVLIDRRIDSILHDTSHQLPKSVSLEQFLAMQGQTMDQARDSLREDAQMSIRREMVVEAIADAEKIELTDAEIEERVRTDATEAGRDADELIAALKGAGGWDSLRQDLRVERAVDLIVTSSKDITPEEGEQRIAVAAKEPVATKPVATKPVAKEPAATKPAAKKPVAKEPAAKKPVATKPVAKEPAAKKPVAKEPAATKRVATKPAATKPVATKPAATKPAATKSAATKSVATTPVVKEPAAKKPVAKEPAAKTAAVTKPATSSAKGSGTAAAKKTPAAEGTAKKPTPKTSAAKTPTATTPSAP